MQELLSVLNGAAFQVTKSEFLDPSIHHGSCLFYSELTASGLQRALHEKAPLLGDPILHSAFGNIARFADHFSLQESHLSVSSM